MDLSRNLHMDLLYLTNGRMRNRIEEFRQLYQKRI